jgi:DNA-binding transcriptional MocR family regulator
MGGIAAMNAGSTMQRVYATIKERIMTGQFAPGERLDPARLAPDLASSSTPVRDALHRLVGERLIESSQHDGFRQLQISEPAIRDMYEWTHQLAILIISSSQSAVAASAEPLKLGQSSYTEVVQTVFSGLADMSPNHEHRAAMKSLLDRSRIYQNAESRLLEGAIPELLILHDAIASRAWHNVRILLNRYYKRRLRVVGKIAASLR